MSNWSDYLDLISEIGPDSFSVSRDNSQLDNNPFYDKYQTAQQKRRDLYISKLLANYVNHYKAKTKSNHWYKVVLFCVALIWVTALFIFFGYILLKAINSEENNLAVIIGSFVSLVGLPIGIIKVIATYIFPKNEEQHITQIVKNIQDNDLENKKVNIGANQTDNKDNLG